MRKGCPEPAASAKYRRTRRQAFGPGMDSLTGCRMGARPKA